MSDPEAAKTAGGDGGTPPPPQPDTPPPPPPPPEPPNGPPSGHAFGWHLWTLQNAAILVFMALALAAIIIALFVVATPTDGLTGHNPLLALHVLNTLLIAIAVTLVFAWLSNANAQMIGRGFRHLLSIHRAAVACFVVSGAATVGILIYVALAIMAAAEVAHGLYLLAAIELLLKLTAVSAIIVLITLRRTTAMVLPASQASGEHVAAALEAQEDRGRLEFGSLAFAFGLVVIAALVVPTDDLMRISAMMFGGDRKVEDYLPQRPLVRVEDDMANQIATAVQNAPALRDLTDDMSNAQRDALSNSIEAGISSVIYNIVGDRVKRIGAWPLFVDICHDKEDALISTNSSNKLVAEHISYLAGEGLIDFPYGDIQTLDITQYGSQVIFKNEGLACADAKASVAINVADTASPVMVGASASRSERTLTSAPDEIVIAISQLAESIRLELPPGDYLVSLVALDRVDPFLQVVDDQGTIFAENDDGGPGVFDSALSIRVAPGQVYVARASTLDSAGNAILRVERETRIELISAEQLVREEPAVPIAESVEIPPLGAVFQFVAEAGGPHVIDVMPNGGPDADLTGELFRKSGEAVESLAADDDGGEGGFPRLRAELIAGETYYLVLQHFAPGGAPVATARIDVRPDMPPANEEAQPVDQTEPLVPAPATEAETPQP
ncbi:hypothetical protein ACLI1C_12710 [Devosia sp. XGJD_8]|uniref:hypothetical protein n=1 Tax=Devosia sp. XGJD_8 TaxID=3391187 RepID=UPI0039850761